ncbi:hypothetical protein LWI29_035873 [Acer saccharum]|uniref:Uncharacterized protein n=1 Tax=Acer saccharum TaxID=4024 RepID=A0AA39T2V5_ACESA|nr:hypothetical protein LWI29_035873 [Acer saccharum]
MTAIVVQEEETIHKSKKHSAHMVTQSYKGKKKFSRGKKSKYSHHGKKVGKTAGFLKAKDKSKGYRFYCPTYSMRIVESKHVVFLEEGTDVGKNMQTQEFAFEEERSGNPTSSTSLDIVIPPLHEHHDESLFEQDDEPLPVIDEPQPIICEPEPAMMNPSQLLMSHNRLFMFL